MMTPRQATRPWPGGGEDGGGGERGRAYLPAAGDWRRGRSWGGTGVPAPAGSTKRIRAHQPAARPVAAPADPRWPRLEQWPGDEVLPRQPGGGQASARPAVVLRAIPSPKEGGE